MADAHGGGAARRITVVTVARSDYSILRPVMQAIAADPRLELSVVATGMHLAPEFGLTVEEIERDGLPVTEKLDMLVAGNTPQAIGKSMGLGVAAFAQHYARSQPDILVILGDRFEMMAATLAALPFRIPVAHIHGGEVTEGAMDESLRHSITKLSHLHFASTDGHARRIVQLGEEPWRVSVSGAPALDNLKTIALPDRAALEARLEMSLAVPPLLVTFHPTTLEYDRTEADTRALLAALDAAGQPLVITYPNADTEGARIIALLTEFARGRADCRLVRNLGIEGYYGMLRQAAAMVGNSSSGIIEAASFQLPVVNIGNRQRGRSCGANVIHCAAEAPAILAGIRRALDPDFRASLDGLVNIYGTGTAAAHIVERLATVSLDQRLIMKAFHDQ